MAASFVHLHTHTEYSILDGASRIEDLVAAAAADGQPALGITDHGNMYGVLDFYRACRAAGINPVVGVEAYMARDSRYERPPRRGRVDDSGGDIEGGGKLYYHLTLLADSNVGYQNLIQVSSRAFLEGYYYKPRCDWEILSDHSAGLIATTGCLGGQVPQALLRGDTADAETRAAKLQDIFGKDSFYVELQDHGIAEQQQINPQLIDLARRLDAPLLATNDSHYTAAGHAAAHDALLCVQTGALISDTNRLRFGGSEHYLKSAGQMRHLFADVPQACDNTLLIGERAQLEIEFDVPRLPTFDVPEPFDSDSAYLRNLAYAGAKERWGDPLPDKVAKRVEFELDVIDRMGFASYFLIVWDLVSFARSRGIRVGPGRGSAAGCAVAYSLRITDLDPIRYGLLFERFLNPERVSMPDIDLDFDSRRRDELIVYVAERYGRDHVAQIITFGRIKARAAVRDAARVLGHPPALGDRIAKAMPRPIAGRDVPLGGCLEDSDDHHEGYLAAAELRRIIDADPDAAAVVDVALGLEGMRRSDGIHAAAVVISPTPLTDVLPVQRKPGTDGGPAPLVTQYEMHGVEDLGLLKMDLLGLRNLDVITDTVELLAAAGVDVDIDAVPLDDETTFEMLRRGDTIGVFQLEGTPMRALVRSLEPATFDDVAALTALYRPGPMAANMHNDYADRKNGRKRVEYFHDDAAEVLGDTYGLMIYQESVMRVAQRFAGYSLSEADSLRKAMGKKIRSAMAAEEEKFVAGVDEAGYGETLGRHLFRIIEQFADYAFNKSHSYGYGLVAYQTAYLKANYPVEYLAALLTSVSSKLDSAAVYLNECRRSGIAVTPPDVNRSQRWFAPDADSRRITFSLAAVRNVGTSVTDRIISERESGGPYASFVDFVERVDLEALNKRTIESLIRGGAFDSLGHPRKGLLQVYEPILEMTSRRRREHDAGMMTLFGSADSAPSFDDRPDVPDIEYDRASLLAAEKEMLGLYVSGHPLDATESRLQRLADTAIGDLAQIVAAAPGGETQPFCTVGGVVTGLTRRHTRRGDLMATFTLEDRTDAVEVLVFPKMMAVHGPKLADDAVVAVRARIEPRDDVMRLIAADFTVVDAAERTGRPLRIRLQAAHQHSQMLQQLHDLFETHPGDTPVEFHLGGGRVARLSVAFRVDPMGGLAGELLVLLGADAIIAHVPAA